MPLFHLEKLENGGYISIWKITESEEELTATYNWLENEREDFETINLSSRRLEWLSLRMALHAIFENAKLKATSVYKTKFNKPKLLKRSYHISFSHCHGYAAVILHKKYPVGIDIETHGERAFRIKRKFLNENEMDAFGNSAENALIAWCLKETLYKIWGRKKLDFREHMHIKVANDEDPMYSAGTVAKNNQVSAHKLEIRRYEDCIVAYNLD